MNTRPTHDELLHRAEDALTERPVECGTDARPHTITSEDIDAAKQAAVNGSNDASVLCHDCGALVPLSLSDR